MSTPPVSSSDAPVGVASNNSGEDYPNDWLKKLGVFPGALMILPLLIAAIINSTIPHVLEIGGFTSGLFKTGLPAILGLFFFCMGSQLDFRTTRPTLEKGLSLLIGKATIGIAIGLSVAFLTPNGVLWGLTPMVIIAGMTNSNGALYAALMASFGNKTDRGGAAVLALNDGPFITMIALGVAGLANFPAEDLVAMVIPLLLGFVIGNLSPSARKFLRPGESLLIPFLGFLVGASIDFRVLFTSGAQGIILGFVTVVLSGAAGMFALYLYHAIHRHPPETRSIVGGMAEGTVAGNAIATPAAIALADPSFAAVTESATAQIAAAVVTTTLLVPFATSFIAKWQQRRGVSSQLELEMYQQSGRI